MLQKGNRRAVGNAQRDGTKMKLPSSIAKSVQRGTTQKSTQKRMANTTAQGVLLVSMDPKTNYRNVPIVQRVTTLPGCVSTNVKTVPAAGIKGRRGRLVVRNVPKASMANKQAGHHLATEIIAGNAQKVTRSQMQNRLPVKFALWDAMKTRREGVKDIANVVKREGT